MGITTDPTDPALGHGHTTEPGPQNQKHLVLSNAERAKGFVRPVRDTYRHTSCGQTTTMGSSIAETYARDPAFYGSTFCAHCSLYRPVGENGEFVWIEADRSDGPKVGT